MKVTATIREYIRAEVAKILDTKVNPYAEQAKADKQKINDLVDEIYKVQKEMVDKFIAETGLLDSWRDKLTPFNANLSAPSFHYAVTPAMLDSKKWEEEHNKYKESKTREIIAKLELGANRQELEAMLAELMED